MASQKPQTTLITRNDEAAQLRRTIGAPGMPSEEIEMDLEEIQELADALSQHRAADPVKLSEVLEVLARGQAWVEAEAVG